MSPSTLRSARKRNAIGRWVALFMACSCCVLASAPEGLADNEARPAGYRTCSDPPNVSGAGFGDVDPMYGRNVGCPTARRVVASKRCAGGRCTIDGIRWRCSIRTVELETIRGSCNASRRRSVLYWAGGPG